MESAADFEVKEDLRQSKEYGRYMEKIGWRVEKGVFIRKLGPVSIAKIQRTNLPEGLNKILSEHRVFMCKCEPINGKPVGFRQDNWPLLGTKTLRVDLRPSLDKIFGSFNKDCRYTLRKVQGSFAQRARFKVQVDNFDGFYEIWKKSAMRKNLWIPGKKEYDGLIESLGKKCFCVTIGSEAGAVILMHDKTAYYYYAGATKAGNEMDTPYLVVWEAMKEAKRKGADIWDFEGIYDARWPNKGWAGFSHFKKNFGGNEIEFPGSFTRWSWPYHIKF